MYKNRKAFSLMELSIVILIIGIITTGITQSSKLVNSFRLSSARNQTQNSPVNSTTGLIAWFESTSNSSFLDAETGNNLTVSSWNDINPQLSLKHNPIQLIPASRPVYTTSVINGLPALKFNGTSQYLEYAYNSDMNPSNFTLFVVAQPAATPSANAAIVSSGDSTLFTGYHLYAMPSLQYETLLGTGAAWQGSAVLQSATVSKANLLEATYDGTTYTLYNSGSSVGTAAFANFSPNANRVFRIGAGRNENATPAFYFNGYVGEVILFNRVLKTDERTSVEDYLEKKWAL